MGSEVFGGGAGVFAAREGTEVIDLANGQAILIVG